MDDNFAACIGGCCAFVKVKGWFFGFVKGVAYTHTHSVFFSSSPSIIKVPSSLQSAAGPAGLNTISSSRIEAKLVTQRRNSSFLLALLGVRPPLFSQANTTTSFRRSTTILQLLNLTTAFCVFLEWIAVGETRRRQTTTTRTTPRTPCQCCSRQED